MKTVILLQFILICITLSYGDWWEYHMANAVAQLVLWFYALFPFRALRVAGTVMLGLAVLSSSMLLLISFVRAWRYFFFPVKEQLKTSLECLANIPLVVAQIAFMFIQSKSLLEVKAAVYMKNLYKNTVYIMFFHDFVYAWALAPFGGVYIVFAFTHFVVHTLMLAQDVEMAPFDGIPSWTVKWWNLMGFRILWLYLIGQHVYVITQLYEYTIVLGMTGVYIVSLLMYLVNSYLQNRTRITATSTIE